MKHYAHFETLQGTTSEGFHPIITTNDDDTVGPHGHKYDVSDTF